MIILPAIDILDQQPVRLYQGDYEQKECVGDSIADIARAFEQQGRNMCIWSISTVPKRERKSIRTAL